MATTLHKQSHIQLKTFFHRDEMQIGFYFDYSQSIYQQLKKIHGARYSKTFKCLYIPCTKAAFNEFKALGYSYIIVKNQDDDSRTRQSPEKSDLSAKTLTGPMNEGRKLDADIQPQHGLDAITWQDNSFFIHIQYNKEVVRFLKTLYGSYWNAKQGLWICKGTQRNQIKLQERFSYWDEATYQKLLDKTTSYNQQAKVIIKSIAKDLSKLEVQIKFASKAVDWVKLIPLRAYNQETKSWFVPRDKTIIDRFIDKCRSAGYIVHELFSWKLEMPLAKSRNGEKWLKSVLHGVPADQLALMQSYATVFIREKYSYQTMKAYCTSFRRYLYSLQDLQTINERTLSDIEDYLNHIVLQEVSYQELNRHISAIKFYYEKLGGWSKMRLSQVQRPRRPKSLPHIFSIAEVKRLLSQLKHPKHRCMLFLAYGCGLRAGEVVSLQVRDIMIDRHQIYIRGGKGKKDRVVMMPKSVLPILDTYIQQHRPDHWLFPGQNRNRPYSRSSLSKVFKSAIVKAGLDRRHKLHNLRHSFATHLMESGTQQRLIQKLLGHASSKTTEIYTHISRGSIEQVESPLDKLAMDIDKKKGKE